MGEVALKLPSGATLCLSREVARDVARRLWDSAAEAGSAPLAVAINSALASPRVLSLPIEVSEREAVALDRVLDERSRG